MSEDRHQRQNQLRARARLVDERAAEVAGLMADGRWVTGKSHAELAERWGCDMEEVRHVAQRAGQALRVLMLTDRESLRARNAATLEAIVADARADGEHQAAVAALNSQAKLLGLNAPERHEVATVQAVEAMTPEAKLARVREQIAVLQELERELAAQVGEVLALPEGN